MSSDTEEAYQAGLWLDEEFIREVNPISLPNISDQVGLIEGLNTMDQSWTITYNPQSVILAHQLRELSNTNPDLVLIWMRANSINKLFLSFIKE